MRKVLTGAHLVYLVTAYSGNSSSKKIEIEQGKNIARLSKVKNYASVFFATLGL
jgi:hypothetical protein